MNLFILVLLLFILLCPLEVHLDEYDEPPKHGSWYYSTRATSPTTKPMHFPYPEKYYFKLQQADITKREIGAIIQMTIEFLKDMDMKMRDVNRIEKMYVRSFDFGSGKLYQQLENIFDHMVVLYKNTSSVNKLFELEGDDFLSKLRPNVAGSLQFMLSDYMEFLSITDIYKERYHHFKSSSKLWDIRETISKYLKKRGVYPYKQENDDDDSNGNGD